jgi:hypothetical protein
MSGKSINWTELIVPLFAAISMYARFVVRKETQLLSDKAAIATATTEQTEQLLTAGQAAGVLDLQPQPVCEWVPANKFSEFAIGSSLVQLKHGNMRVALKTPNQPVGRRKCAQRIQKVTKQKKAKGGATVC